MNKRIIYGMMAAGGVVGLVASFLQMIEKIQLLKNADKVLACDLNSIFNCSNVLGAWQSSIFGFPNSMICMVVFTVFAATGLAGISGSTLTQSFRHGVHALSLFVLGFALWFLWQSMYVIGSLCILCLFCFAGLLVINWAWLRLNANDLPIGNRGREIVARSIQNNIDTFIWVLLAVVMIFAALLRFY